MNPPRYLRALYIAALCNAGAALITMAPAPALARATPGRLERRDRSIRNIVRSLGRAMIAAGRAQTAFAERGALYTPPQPIAAPIDPRIQAIMACPVFAAAIGAPSAVRSIDQPWIEVSAEPPRITIYWRGARIAADRYVRVQGERGRIEPGNGRSNGSVRELSKEHFGRAVQAAVVALTHAGFRCSGFVEIRTLKIGKTEDENGDEIEDALSFKGLVATVGLARPRPSWMQPAPKRGFARL